MRVILIEEKNLEALVEAAWRRLNGRATELDDRWPIVRELFRGTELELHDLRKEDRR
jgi:hypothetical protein